MLLLLYFLTSTFVYRHELKKASHITKLPKGKHSVKGKQTERNDFFNKMYPLKHVPRSDMRIYKSGVNVNLCQFKVWEELLQIQEPLSLSTAWMFPWAKASIQTSMTQVCSTTSILRISTTLIFVSLLSL